MQDRNCPKPCCQPVSHNGLAYALYYQTDTLFNTAANGSIDITQTAAETSGDFLSDGSQVQILCPGVYHIVYTIHIPAETALTTNFVLQANRQNIDGTRVVVAKTGVDTPTVVSGETILEVCSPVTVRVVSTTLLDYTGETDEVLATLFIQQLGR